jgi:hypothetical protein
VILPISSFEMGRITGVNHYAQLDTFNFKRCMHILLGQIHNTSITCIIKCRMHCCCQTMSSLPAVELIP